MSELFKKVKAEIMTQKPTIAADKITMDADLSSDLGLDSMEQLLMVSTLEDEFGVELDENVFMNIKTVGDAVKSIEELEI